MIDSCPVCNTASEALIGVDKTEYGCPRCGKYSADATASHLLPEKLTATQRADFGDTARDPGIFIANRELEFFLKYSNPYAGEKADKLLLGIAKSFPTAGQIVLIDPFAILQNLAALFVAASAGQALRQLSKDEAGQIRWGAVAWTVNSEELEYLLTDFLKRQSWIECDDTFPNNFLITPSGWARIDELTRGTIASHKGFVAMSFRDNFREPLHKGS